MSVPLSSRARGRAVISLTIPVSGRLQRKPRIPDAERTCLVQYASVLLRLLQDLGDPKPSHREDRLTALRWFTEEFVDVALVATACGLSVWSVYAEAAQRVPAPNCARPVQITGSRSAQALAA